MLRFAPFIRCSTEDAARKGSTLEDQKAQLTPEIEKVGGTIPKWYGGQEHSSEGYERKKLDELLSDARAGKFDAVMVVYNDRLGRYGKKQDEFL